MKLKEKLAMHNASCWTRNALMKLKEKLAMHNASCWARNAPMKLQEKLARHSRAIYSRPAYCKTTLAENLKNSMVTGKKTAAKSHHNHNGSRRGQEHTVNDVNNSVAGQVVGFDHILEILGFQTWAQTNLTIPLSHMQWLAFNGLDRLEWFQIFGQHLFREDMISQNINEFLLTLWLHQLC